MANLALLFVGAVLLINGLVLLGRADARGAAPINLFVGFMELAVGLYVALPARDLALPGNADAIIAAAGSLLFAFTYLYVGIGNYIPGHDGRGLGWFCGWASLLSLTLAIVSLVRFEDVRFATLWVLWFVLFASFFALLALERRELQPLVGWITVIESFVTGSVPAVLLLLGAWDDVPEWAFVAVGAATLASFGLIASATRTRAAAAAGRASAAA